MVVASNSIVFNSAVVRYMVDNFLLDKGDLQHILHS